jgi:hypothetical protein
MESLASGTGYMDLEAREIQGTQPAGTGTVDGVPVTIYKLSESGLLDPNVSGLTSEQISTIRAADAIIENGGFAGKTTWVSVDSEGYIREQKTQYTLPDGSMVTEDSILSNFGCAGTVLMPGQAGTSSPPANCVSPDTAGSPTTTTTPPTDSRPQTTTPTTVAPSAPPTTLAPAPVPTTVSETPLPSIAVTPSGPYTAGEVVMIAGSNFPASAVVNFGECPSNIDCVEWLKQATTDAGGSFSAQLTLQSAFTLSRPINGQSSWSCATVADGCHLFAAPTSGPEGNTIPIAVSR